MDFSFREDEEAVAELARKILEDHATNERLKELEAGDAPRDDVLWQALAESNLLGTAIPEAHGFFLGMQLVQTGGDRARIEGQLLAQFDRRRVVIYAEKMEVH